MNANIMRMLIFCTYLSNARNVGRTTRRMILKDVLFSIHIAVIGEVMEFISVLLSPWLIEVHSDSCLPVLAEMYVWDDVVVLDHC